MGDMRIGAAPIVRLPGHPGLNLKPGKLIIFQHRKHMDEFFQARCQLISPLVSEKYCQRGLQALRLARKEYDVHRILLTIDDQGIKALSAHDCECIAGCARGHHLVAPLPHHADIFAGDRFRTEVENFRTIASSRICYETAFIFRTAGGASDACGFLALLGESPSQRASQ